MPLDRIDVPFRDEGDEAADADDDLLHRPPIEPGDPSAENTLFVLLGVLLALVVVARLVQLFG